MRAAPAWLRDAVPATGVGPLLLQALAERVAELGRRRLAVRRQQEVDRLVGLAAVFDPDVGQDRRVLGEPNRFFSEDQFFQLISLQRLHGAGCCGEEFNVLRRILPRAGRIRQRNS